MFWFGTSPRADFFGRPDRAPEFDSLFRSIGRTAGRTAGGKSGRTAGRTGGGAVGGTGNRKENRTGGKSGSGARSDVQLTRQPDLVLIVWTRNPLNPGSSSRIVSTAVIGSAQPCKSLLKPGERLSNALNCLIRNDFFVVVQRNTSDVSGYILLQRG